MLKKVFQNNLHGIIGTIIFHLILLIIFLSAKIEKVKKVNEQAISIDFVQQLPDIEKIIEQKKEKLAEMQPLSEQTRKNIAVNTAEKLEKQISTKDYIEEVKKELGIKNLNQQLSRDIDNGNVNVPAEEKKEDQGQQKKYMGPTNITYFLENRQKKYLPVPVYKCEGGGKVIVDIITLDSESCAPCQYMVEAVKKVAPQFEGVVEWREHAIKKMEAVTFMFSLMVKNIPTICIDGKIAFVSQIPPRGELIAAIQKRINEKLKLKIKQKKSEILLLCENVEECKGIKQNIQRAITELGKDVEVNVISGQEQMASFGVSQGPAVVSVKYKVKSEGEKPSLDVIKEWIKEL